MPPASETTSGRDATANSARISEATMLRDRSAYEPTNGSRREPVDGSGPTIGAHLLQGCAAGRDARGYSARYVPGCVCEHLTGTKVGVQSAVCAHPRVRRPRRCAMKPLRWV